MSRRAGRGFWQLASARGVGEVVRGASLRPPFKDPVTIGRGKQGLRKLHELMAARRGGRPAKGETAEGTVAKTVRAAATVDL